MSRHCTVSDCERVHAARGYCIYHYNRWYLTGSATATPGRIYFDDEKRFFSKVDKTPSGCWLWTGGTRTRQGYPQFSVMGRNLIAHRWAYETYIGPIPSGYQVDHLCRNINCVRPGHLEAVTQSENLRRQAIARGGYDRRCDIDGCNRPHRCFGMCNTHYLRWKKAGRPPLG